MSEQLGFGSYWNTTRLEGDALRDAVAKAEQQDAAILTIFRNASGPLSPSQVWALCEQAGKRWPITSVRRAISNLTDDRVLEMLESKRDGLYGRPEHEWRVAA